MNNMKTIEKYYRKFLKSFDKLNKETVINIDLALLQKLNLLRFYQKKAAEPGLTRYFQVIETPDKITMLNDTFIVWIVPENIEDRSVTYTIIALNKEDGPKLELVFVLSGVYNTSYLVLSVLEKFLFEIEETENFIKKID